jgi:hypothetical protein
VQLDLPMVVGEPIPILYVQMDGTGGLRKAKSISARELD